MQKAPTTVGAADAGETAEKADDDAADNVADMATAAQDMPTSSGSSSGRRLFQDGSRFLQDGNRLSQDGSRLSQDGSRLSLDGSRLWQEEKHFLAIEEEGKGGSPSYEKGSEVVDKAAAAQQDTRTSGGGSGGGGSGGVGRLSQGGGSLSQDDGRLSQDGSRLTQKDKIPFNSEEEAGGRSHSYEEAIDVPYKAAAAQQGRWASNGSGSGSRLSQDGSRLSNDEKKICISAGEEDDPHSFEEVSASLVARPPSLPSQLTPQQQEEEEEGSQHWRSKDVRDWAGEVKGIGNSPTLPRKTTTQPSSQVASALASSYLTTAAANTRTKTGVGAVSTSGGGKIGGGNSIDSGNGSGSGASSITPANTAAIATATTATTATATTATTTTTDSITTAGSTDLLQQPPFPARRRLRIYPAGNRTNKWVTREIAALEFLTGVRMRNESAIRARATSSVSISGSGAGAGGLQLVDDAEFPLTTGGGENSWRWPQQQQQGIGEGEAVVGSLAPGGVSVGAAEDYGGVGGGDGGGGGGADDQQNDDSDSDNGWLDQPLPSLAEGVGIGGGSGSGMPTQKSRGAPVRRNSGLGRRMTGAGSPAPARRLRGREAAHIRVPATFRHRLQSFSGHSAAVVRQWEQGLTQQEGLLEGRMFFSCSKGYPTMVSSMIHYKPREEQARRVRQKWIDERGAEAFQIPKRDWRGFSYAHLLKPRHVGAGCLAGISESGGGSGGSGGGGGVGGAAVGVLTVGGGTGGIENADGEGGIGAAGGGSGGSGGGGSGGVEGDDGAEAPYKAGFLDDPALKVGKHRYMTRGDQNTGPVVSSVLLFVKPRVLKDELNARFRESHPSLPPSLTLSKIRSIKRQALLGCYRADMDVATVALACIYFERLCLVGVVTKPNRRLAMAACLTIAYKFNEAVLEGVSKLPALWAFVDHEWQVSKKRVLEAEFGVLVQLSFNLHEDPRDIFHHFALLLKMVESNPSLYLGEEMLGLHQEALGTFFRDGSVDEVAGLTAGASGGGPESPRVRTGSEGGTVGGDVRLRAASSQSTVLAEASGWLPRRHLSGSRWLAGWRTAQEDSNNGVGVASNVVGGGSMPPSTRLTRTASGEQQSGGSSNALAKIIQSGRGLGKEARQRSQKLTRNVRSGASTLARGASSRRRSRRRMEA